MSYQTIAIEMDKLMGAEVGSGEIESAARAMLKFRREMHQNPNIKSARGKMIYDWILTLAKQQIDPDERTSLLVAFCRKLGKDSLRQKVDRILAANGVEPTFLAKEAIQAFQSRNFHHEIVGRSQRLYIQGDYFLAVFEAARAYNRLVKAKTHSPNDGEVLMHNAWGWEKGILRVAPVSPDADRHLQSGVLSLSVGLMQAVRNPTVAQPSFSWAMTPQDCLDMLSLISFLLNRLDESTSMRI